MKSIIYLSIFICLLIQAPSINSSPQAVLTSYNDFQSWSGFTTGQFNTVYLPNDIAMSTVLAYSPLPNYVFVCPSIMGSTISLVDVFYEAPESIFLTSANQPCFVYKIVSPSVCESSSAAVPNSWCQSYCTFDTNGSCTGVVSPMNSFCECSSVSRAAKLSQCVSLNAAVPVSWCSTYCHFDQNNVCSVDAHMSSICGCSVPAP